MIFPKRINNNIFFKKEFIDLLLSKIPTESINYWNISVNDSTKTTGGIRFIDGTIDVVYILVNCNHKPVFTEPLIRFIFQNGDYIFDSIYIKYDIKTGLSTYKEYRYDNNLNMVSEYIWNQHIRDYLQSNVICTQYKENIKTKEYVLRNDKKIPELFKELTDVLVIPEDIYDNNIEYLSVKDNQELLYYYIK